MDITYDNKEPFIIPRGAVAFQVFQLDMANGKCLIAFSRIISP